MSNASRDIENQDEWCQVVERATDGSHSALRELYDGFGKLVFSIAYKMLDDRHESEDVTQEVFVKAWKKVGSFDPERCTVRGWFCVLTRSACLDRLRKRSIRPDQIKSKAVEFESVRHNLDENSDSLAVDNRERVGDLLKLLRPDHKQALELMYFKGYTQSEVARILDVPLGTAKSLIRRGLIQLRKVFGQE